jgi:hypothetical protein
MSAAQIVVVLGPDSEENDALIGKLIFKVNTLQAEKLNIS